VLLADEQDNDRDQEIGCAKPQKPYELQLTLYPGNDLKDHNLVTGLTAPTSYNPRYPLHLQEGQRCMFSIDEIDETHSRRRNLIATPHPR
jgi:hypothetical protein